MTLPYTDAELDALDAAASCAIVSNGRVIRSADVFRQLREEIADLRARLEAVEAARDMYFEQTFEEAPRDRNA